MTGDGLFGELLAWTGLAGPADAVASPDANVRATARWPAGLLPVPDPRPLEPDLAVPPPVATPPQPFVPPPWPFDPPPEPKGTLPLATARRPVGTSSQPEATPAQPPTGPLRRLAAALQPLTDALQPLTALPQPLTALPQPLTALPQPHSPAPPPPFLSEAPPSLRPAPPPQFLSQAPLPVTAIPPVRQVPLPAPAPESQTFVPPPWPFDPPPAPAGASPAPESPAPFIPTPLPHARSAWPFDSSPQPQLQPQPQPERARPQPEAATAQPFVPPPWPDAAAPQPFVPPPWPEAARPEPKAAARQPDSPRANEHPPAAARRNFVPAPLPFAPAREAYYEPVVVLPKPVRSRPRVGHKHDEATARAARFVAARAAETARRTRNYQVTSDHNQGLLSPQGAAVLKAAQAYGGPAFPPAPTRSWSAPANARAQAIERALAKGRATLAQDRQSGRRPSASLDSGNVGLAVALVFILFLEAFGGIILFALGGGHLVLAFGLALDACARTLGTVAAARAGRGWGAGWRWACALLGSPAVAAFAFYEDGSLVDADLAPLAGPVAGLAIVCIVIGLAGIPAGI